MCYFLCVTYFVLFSLRAFAVDFTTFLYDPTIQVVQKDNKAQLFPGGIDEKYWAEDGSGQRYKLRLKNAAPSYAEIGLSITAQAMGLPNLPVYPILLRRGERGLPLADQAKALNPRNTFMGLSGSRGEIFPATLQPVTTLKTFSETKLTGKQSAELMGQLLLNYLGGNNDIQFGDGVHGNIGFNGEHFYTLDATQSFKFYPDEHALSPENYLRLFSKKIMQNLSPTEQQVFVEELNTYLARLEKLGSADVEAMFAPYFRSMASFRKFKNLPAFDFANEFLRRISVLRPETASYLQQLALPPQMIESFKVVKAVEKPHIHLPSPSLTIENVPSLKKVGAVESLWGFYFQDFWKARSNAEQEWSKELSAPNPIEVLKKFAASHPKVYSVMVPGAAVASKEPCSKHLGVFGRFLSR